MRIGHSVPHLTSVATGVYHEHASSRRSETEPHQSILASLALHAGGPWSTCAQCIVLRHLFMPPVARALAGVCCSAARRI